MPSITTPGYSASRFLVELEGQSIAAASSVRGGDAVGDVVATTAAGGLVKKRIANLHWEPITFTVGLAMGRDLADWIAAFLSRTASAKDGAIVFLDDLGAVRSRLQWRGGILIEVRFPGCDATGPDTGEVTVTVQPEMVTTSTGGGRASSGTDPRRPTPWSRDRFRLSISGMTHGPGFVTAIEPFTVRSPIPSDLIGLVRQPATSAPQEVSDLVLSVPDVRAAEFDLWLKDFLIDGNRAESDERTATLEYLGPTLETVATLTLQHVGIVRVARERTRSGNAVTARAQVRLYCEEARFSGPAETGSESPAGRTEGVVLGQRWAAGRGSPEELSGLVGRADPGWTAIALPRGHSLIAELRDAGVLPADENGPVELQRRPLVEGLLEGIGLIERPDRPAPDA